MLKRVIEWSMALCIGAMTGFIVSIRQVNPTIEFTFDWRTLVALLGGVWMGHLFWRVIPKDTPGEPRRRRRWLPLLFWLAVLVGAMVFGFGYGMKDLNNQKHHEMLVGAGFALLVLTFVAFLLWRVGKFFEDDHRRFLEQHRHERDP